MKKLKLEHLAPYLPYELKLFYTHTKKIGQISNIYSIGEGFDNEDIKISIDFSEGEHIWMYKPILRPLSDITKEIIHNEERFVPGLKLVDPEKTEWSRMICEFYNPFARIPTHSKYIRVMHDKLGEIISINPSNISHLPYHTFKNLLEWHFDVFGLIEKGLAIDINTLNK